MKQLPENILRRLDKKQRDQLGKAGRTFNECNDKWEAGQERELQKHIENLLRQRGIPFHRARMDKQTTGTLGWPDFTLAFHGVPIAWECKVGTGYLTPEQTALAEKMISHGWQYKVIRNVGSARIHLNTIEPQ